jgi:hypothetical protein
MAAWKPAGIVADALPSTPIGAYLFKIFGPPTHRFGRSLAWLTGPSGMPLNAPQ